MTRTVPSANCSTRGMPVPKARSNASVRCGRVGAWGGENIGSSVRLRLSASSCRRAASSKPAASGRRDSPIPYPGWGAFSEFIEAPARTAEGVARRCGGDVAGKLAVTRGTVSDTRAAVVSGCKAMISGNAARGTCAIRGCSARPKSNRWHDRDTANPTRSRPCSVGRKRAAGQSAGKSVAATSQW